MPEQSFKSSQRPSSVSYTERHALARRELEKPLGLFWSLLAGLMALGLLTFSYLVIWGAPLLRYIPRYRRD